jgi:hypothetical protein
VRLPAWFRCVGDRLLALSLVGGVRGTHQPSCRWAYGCVCLVRCGGRKAKPRQNSGGRRCLPTFVWRIMRNLPGHGRGEGCPCPCHPGKAGRSTHVTSQASRSSYLLKTQLGTVLACHIGQQWFGLTPSISGGQNWASSLFSYFNAVRTS